MLYSLCTLLHYATQRCVYWMDRHSSWQKSGERQFEDMKWSDNVVIITSPLSHRCQERVDQVDNWSATLQSSTFLCLHFIDYCKFLFYFIEVNFYTITLWDTDDDKVDLSCLEFCNIFSFLWECKFPSVSVPCALLWNFERLWALKMPSLVVATELLLFWWKKPVLTGSF